jgi:hypothetical protein
MVGIGLVLYPDWKVGEEYVVDQYVWKDEEDNVYKCKADHTSSLENQPPIQTYWELIPYGKKSGVAIVADQFSVTTADGTGEVTPFVISGSIVGINGTLIVNGTVRANALSATDIYTLTIQSANYSDVGQGFKLDSVTGKANFNDMEFFSRNTTTGDYAYLHAGALSFFYNDNGTFKQYKAVVGQEQGTCVNGQVVYLSNIFNEKPTINLQIGAGIRTYEPALGTAVGQALYMEAHSITEYAPRKWRFTAKATLANVATPFSYSMVNLSCTDYIATTTGYAQANNSANAIPIHLGTLTLQLSGTFNWVLVNNIDIDTNALVRQRNLIRLYFVCAGVITLVYSGYSPEITVGKGTGSWSGSYNFLTNIVAAGYGARTGYYIIHCQAEWQLNGVWKSTMGPTEGPENGMYGRVSTSGLAVNYNVPAGSAIAAGQMIYTATGQ